MYSEFYLVRRKQHIKKKEVTSIENLRVFSSTEFGELNVMTIKDKEFFPATQCAKILGYANTKDAILRHCKGGVKRVLPTNGGVQAVNYMPESGLSRLMVSLDTGIHRDCLDNYEQMRNLPGTPALCKLAEYFGVTETELLHGGEIDRKNGCYFVGEE